MTGIYLHYYAALYGATFMRFRQDNAEALLVLQYSTDMQRLFLAVRYSADVPKFFLAAAVQRWRAEAAPG